MKEVKIYLHRRQKYRQNKSDEPTIYGPGEVTVPVHIARAFGFSFPHEPQKTLNGQIAIMLVNAGYPDRESVINATDEELLSVPGMGPKNLEKVRARFSSEE